MKKPVLLTLLFALISMSFSFAQTRVTGTVTSSDDGTGVPFATIVVKGNNNLITTTDANGNYVFPNIPGNAVLVISSIGFTTLEISVNNRSVVNALLSPDATALEEVMVVAYGSVRRRDLTSAVATVRGDELIKAPVASMDQAMQGKMAGVQITASSGSPGAAVVVRVRGAASLLASNDPLYVVDGVPMPGSRDDTYLGYGGASTNAIAGINPADIESIQVLKDASAAALYGSRASNGVILITTKSGKAQKTKVNFDAYYGVQNLRQRIEMLGATEWIAAQNEARDNYNSSLGFLPGNSRYVQPISPSVPGVDVDWLGEVTRSAPLMSSIQVSTSGGNEGTQFYLSAGRFQQQGLVYNDDFLRYSFRSRIDHRFNSKVRLSLNANYSFSDNNRIYNDNNIYGVLLNAFRQRPDQPVYDPNNPENYFNTTRTNAVACYKEVEPHNRNQRLIGNFRFEWELIKNLTFNSTLAADITNIHEYQKLTKKAPQAGGGDEATDVSNYQYNWLVDNTLSYRNSFGPVSMTALVGQSFNQVQLLRAWVRGFGFVTDDLKWI
ncbi:MAG: SusC/RagA family TonB-linked outer membrane protein, partial [Bacteroidales bacterium]|nr:SusC/RagA family TonB-linked outer membrane protein [Bacteroidales bacterium]